MDQSKEGRPLDPYTLSKKTIDDVFEFSGDASEEQIYLEKNVYPVLIPGVVDLLRSMAEDGYVASKKLNPVHFLASYLMRHNPNGDEGSVFQKGDNDAELLHDFEEKYIENLRKHAEEHSQTQ
eukprot:TRINITY_DN1110_c0_g1_i1.p1 TRINITY_DN1110_c0_g1~~TRINITY_DN1110_c0_g1_i1.p1  ORF type:complete len:123 (-),score=39.77 TRINITY_DN1110_c0_g1_i1:190-558(-)